MKKDTKFIVFIGDKTLSVNNSDDIWKIAEKGTGMYVYAIKSKRWYRIYPGIHDYVVCAHYHIPNEYKVKALILLGNK